MRPKTGRGVAFAKYHGLGNDYLVVEPGALEGVPDLGEAAVRMCHRNRGIGADGVLVGPLPSERAPFAVRIFNPDGSEAEKSGNGLRIFARYLWDTGRVHDEAASVDTKGGLVSVRVSEGGQMVWVMMGHATFQSGAIGLVGPEREVIRETLVFPERTFTFCGVSVGNPHCVIVDAPATPETARTWGPLIERLPRFTGRTNVQFLEVIDRQNIRIEIWERGAGYTTASGSSSSAAACVARRLGLCDASIDVHMPGGDLRIEIGEDYRVCMTGAVAHVGTGEVSRECLGDLFGAS